MPRRPAPLPATLASSGFTVLEARAAGVSLTRLRAADLRTPASGIRHPRELAPDAVARAGMLGSRHPGAFLSHFTAAACWGLQVEPRNRIERERIDLAVHAELPRPRGKGVRGHRLDLSHDELVTRDGLEVTSPARTWLDLASVGCGIEDLTVAADRIVWARHPLATVHQLERMLLRHRGARGIRSLRIALDEAIEDADSSRETRLRLHIIGAGLPRPVAAHVVRDAYGRAVATADLAFVEHRVLLEYEGDHHRTDRGQWAHDLDRFNRLQGLGWICFRIGAAQFARPDEVVAVVAHALAARASRDMPGA
ncbi:hypothetical protein [Agromyces sp. PvR057]|uniref:hypothetical protein n=1 Tax=Agromyces sp. PvR057 TaxID=3156403 RepID=UPI003396B6F8